MGRVMQLVVTIPVPLPDKASVNATVFALSLAADSVRDALHKSMDPIARTATVENLDCQHADSLNADYGMVVDCGLPRPIRVYPNGGWLYPGDPDGSENDEASTDGDDFDGMMAFVQRMKGGEAL